MSQLLTQHHVAVASIGEHVEITIGNWVRSMHYETALLFCSWMVTRATEAKSWAGDVSGGFSMMATLHDGTKGPDADQPFTPLGVRRVARDVIRKEALAVEQERDMVVARFGRSTVTIPYKEAFTIAQWIRLRAKESKRRAGDLARPWGDIVAASDPAVTRG